MNRLAFATIATGVVFLVPQPATADSPTNKAIDALVWHDGTSAQPVTDRATITLSPHTRYLDPANTDQLLTLTGNLPEKDSYTIASDNMGWFAIVDFSDLGYVKDDEKIDADALLESMRKSQEEANGDRVAQKLNPLTITGWSVPPHYDPATHNLEFGTVLQSKDGRTVNYTMRILGRRGVMNATLVGEPATLQHDLGEFRAAMAGFAFKPDESYAAYKEGDKVSEYGLAALIAGGTAAAVLKGGAAKGILALLIASWKFIAIGFVAVLGTLRKFWGRLTGAGTDLGPPPGDTL